MVTFYVRRYCALLGISLILPVFSLWAQPTFTLQQLVDTAQLYVPTLKQKQALVNASKASLTEVKHSFLPQVRVSEQLNIGSNNSMAGTFFTFGITPSTSAGVRAENDYSPVTGNVAVAYSEYELVNFGLNSAKLNNARAAINLQEADLRKEAYFLQLEIARLYFNLLKYQYRLQADKQNTERYQTVFSIIHALTASGIKPGADSSLAKAELSKARINYNQTVGRIAQLKQQLSYLTGIADKSISIDTLGNSTIYMDMPATAVTEQGNPLIDYYTKKRDVYFANGNLIRKAYLPRVILASALWARGSSIQYNDNFKSLSTGLGYQRFNYAVGLAVTYNLFNGVYRKDKLQTNRYQQQASEFELEQQKLALASAALQADHVLATTRANLLELPVQLSSAQAVFNQKTAQYKAGIISLIDVTNASFVLYRSQTDYIETISDWYLAQLDRAASTGTLTQFIQTIK